LSVKRIDFASAGQAEVAGADVDEETRRHWGRGVKNMMVSTKQTEGNEANIVNIVEHSE
jgi:hypothetical protein